jgi:phenylacetate-CoA ligase
MIDRLKGSPVKKQYNDIIEKENDSYDPHADLENILQYAIEHVPFYKDIRQAQLEQFPVMKKAVYKQNKTACFSDEYQDLSRLHKVSTSGSTGEPMVAYQNKEKRNRVKADLIHAHEKIGWDLGRKYIFIRNWASNYRQSPIKIWAQNFKPFGISDFDDIHKKELIDSLKKHSNTVLFGYSSSICDFMNFLRKEKIDGRSLRIRVIVCDSDELTKQNKVKLKACFGCPVINRYDNEENGLIAITSPDSDIFRVNYQGLYIELLEDDSDRPVEPGTMGKVVITDLFNKAMPLIRYDTGDYAISDDEVGHIRTLREICGRQAGSLTALNGNIVSSVAISVITEIFYNIEKYQIRQVDRTKFVFQYVGTISESEQAELMERLKTSLGDAADISIINVSEIEKGKNGKYNTIINNYKL